MSEEQRFMCVERLFWDLNFLPQMGQSGTPGGGGGGGGAGARSSLSSKHLQMEIVLLLSVRHEVNSKQPSNVGGDSRSSRSTVSRECLDQSVPSIWLELKKKTFQREVRSTTAFNSRPSVKSSWLAEDFVNLMFISCLVKSP